jgi:hypothetical protein
MILAITIPHPIWTGVYLRGQGKDPSDMGILLGHGPPIIFPALLMCGHEIIIGDRSCLATPFTPLLLFSLF